MLLLSVSCDTLRSGRGLSDSHQSFQWGSVEHTCAQSESILLGRALVLWVTGAECDISDVFAAPSIADNAAEKWLRRLTRASIRLRRSLFSAFVALSSARKLIIASTSSSGGVESSSFLMLCSSDVVESALGGGLASEGGLTSSVAGAAGSSDGSGTGCRTTGLVMFFAALSWVVRVHRKLSSW